MSSRDIAKTIALSATTASANGQVVELTSCSAMSLTVLVTVTAATLSAAISVTGTNDDARAADLASPLPALRNGVIITGATALPTGLTYADGVLTFAVPFAIGTYEVTILYPAFPKWAKVAYAYTSGGGDVAVRATLSAWSV